MKLVAHWIVLLRTHIKGEILSCKGELVSMKHIAQDQEARFPDTIRPDTRKTKRNLLGDISLVSGAMKGRRARKCRSVLDPRLRYSSWQSSEGGFMR